MVTGQTRSNENFILTVNEASLEFYADIREYLCGLSKFEYFLCTEHVGSANKINLKLHLNYHLDHLKCN